MEINKNIFLKLILNIKVSLNKLFLLFLQIFFAIKKLTGRRRCIPDARDST